MQSIYFVVESLIHIVSKIIQMDINGRTSLIGKNLKNLGGLNGLFIMHGIEIFDEFTYSNSLS